jgi:hypothetical protein
MQRLAQRHSARNVTIPYIPTGKITYIDKIGGWLRRPLSKQEYAIVEGDCGHGAHPSKKPKRPFFYKVQRCWFDPELNAYLEVKQPGPDALKVLDPGPGLFDEPPNLMLNRAERSLDLIFPDLVTARKAFWFQHRHHVMPRHGRQLVRLFEDWEKRNGEITTRYAGWNTVNVLASYWELPSKVTGEPCLHLDWRSQGSQTLQRQGIYRLHDLVTEDQVEFWGSNFDLYGWDHQKLGRAYRRIRPAWCEGWSDWRAGIEVVRKARKWVDGRQGVDVPMATTQVLVNRFGAELRDMKRLVLSEIDKTAWMPDRREVTGFVGQVGGRAVGQEDVNMLTLSYPVLSTARKVA